MQHPAPPWKPTNQKQQLRGLSGVQLTTLPPTSAPRVKTWQQMTSPSCQRSPYLCEFCWHQVCRGLRKTGWITVSRKVEKGMDYIWKNFIERERESMYRVYAYSIHTHSVKTNVYIYICTLCICICICVDCPTNRGQAPWFVRSVCLCVSLQLPSRRSKIRLGIVPTSRQGPTSHGWGLWVVHTPSVKGPSG